MSKPKMSGEAISELARSFHLEIDSARTWLTSDDDFVRDANVRIQCAERIARDVARRLVPWEDHDQFLKMCGIE